MPMFAAQIVPMAERVYRLVPLDKIKVLNSRNREKQQWEDNVKSIDTVGLLKPIVINARFLEKDGHYQLVCGEGRFLAFKKLGKDKIPAEVINCDRKTALLYSLVENIARVPPDTIWFAREMKRMKDAGMSMAEMCRITGRTDSYIEDYIRLVEMGEERLIKGVEAGLFSMSFATIIARSSSADVQNVLMDAFDSGMISCANAARVRNLIEQRIKGYKQTKRLSRQQPAYTLKELKRDMERIAREKEGFVNQTTEKENRLLMLLDGLNTLSKDEAFMAILKERGLAARPELLGTYNI